MIATGTDRCPPARPTRAETLAVLSRRGTREMREKYTRYVLARLAGCESPEQYDAEYRRLMGDLLA